MNTLNGNALFRRIAPYELVFCRSLNRLVHHRGVRPFFASASRLGDGLVWYVLIGLMPLLYGRAAWEISLRMVLTGAVGVGLYKLLKTRLARTRPFEAHQGIVLGTAPLDKYSFPSGHTLHAVSFSLIVIAYHPQWAWLLVPFSGAVALSRVVLGLHYPTDVLAGAAIGALLASIGLQG